MRNLLQSLISFIIDTLETIVLALAIFLVINLFVAQLHQVLGNSMLPNFHHGEYLLTDKLSYRLREPQRGEIVIFKSPEFPHRDYIKRIIALPEESIKIENGKVIIYNKDHPQGLVLRENYLGKGIVTEGKRDLSEGVKIKIPEGHFVVLGDNRPLSSDSRTWGPVPKKDIIGRALLRLWPPSALALISPAVYPSN